MRTLTTCAPRLHESVKWSPDGGEVLFSVGSDVYGVGADGSGLRKVAHRFVGGRAGKMTAFDVSADGRSSTPDAIGREETRPITSTNS